MDWQTPIVYGLILLATLFVLRSSWRTWFGSTAGGCGSGCGKCAAPPKDTTTADARRISLPQV